MDTFLLKYLFSSLKFTFMYHFIKGNNFSDFRFGFLGNKTLPKGFIHGRKKLLLKEFDNCIVLKVLDAVIL